jgi:hypothetical protein
LDGAMAVLDPREQTPGTPCILTSTTAPEPFGSFAITQLPEPLEIVGVGVSHSVWSYRDGRWAKLREMVPEQPDVGPTQAGSIRIGPRRFAIGNGGPELLIVEDGVAEQIPTGFMRVDGSIPDANALAWDPEQGVLLALDDLGIVAIDLLGGARTNLIPIVDRIDALIMDHGLLTYVDHAGLISRGRGKGGASCEPIPTVGNGGRFLFHFDEDTLINTDVSYDGVPGPRFMRWHREPTACGD